ncbi:MAG: hypothetical protein WD872_21975 [Pirellulaceae bacterium]
MIHDRLLDELDKVAARYRQLRFWQGLAAAWLLAALVGLGLLALKRTAGGAFTLAVPVLLLGSVALAGLGIWLAITSARNYPWIARQVEAAFPELRTCLLAAVEQQPELPGGRFGYLQASVIHQALLHSYRQPWKQVVPTRRIALAMAGNLTTLTLLVAVLFALGFTAGAGPGAVAALAGARPLLSDSGFAVTVEPGDTEVEKGTSLLVLARVQGQIPAEATLVFAAASGEESRLVMSRSLDDPVFGSRIATVAEPLEYFVEIGGQTTSSYRVGVFEYPRLERADARLVYPAYTRLEPRLVQDVRTVSVVEGTRLELSCYLNKPVATATLVPAKSPDGQSPPIELSAVAGDQPVWAATIVCERSQRLSLVLIDEAGRQNVQPASFTINVLPNQPVALKPTFPARDLEASPLEELDIRATAWDDFGVARFGVTYSLAGELPVEKVLGTGAAPREKHELAYRISLEQLQAEPDQLLSYHWWAEDLDSGGQVRRVESDMYFAEVRPFEEIYRQGEQPPGGGQQSPPGQQGQNAQQAQQLAQLQKEIINATWKVVRREIGSKLTETFASDAEQLLLSQETALEQAAALAGRLQDPESLEHVGQVLRTMQEAARHLQEAKQGPAREPLTPALAAEQAAYQALLKLRAREHRVVRQQQSSSRGSASNRSEQQRQQMEQLDLQNEENRYETERAAQADPQETPAEREDRQVLSRLRDLARRQHDLNERAKELQAALEESQTPEQQAELRRQLKRLQEEQRQMLEETDELQSRMQQPENQQRMAEQAEQLEETRDQVRRASEALEQEQVTQAAAAGTRAERQFEELRNEFRRRAAVRFTEEMRQMREAAQELDQRERDLAERLAPQEESSDQAKSDQAKSERAKSLQSEDPREGVVKELAEQRARLGALQEQMRQTIGEAEQTEPLLAERLYEAARGIEEQNLARALAEAETSLRRGLMEDARQREEAAQRGIGQLREGIERAAEAVLGDETEALRRAREELQELSRELNEEIARNNPNAERQPGQGQQPGEPSEGQPNREADASRSPGRGAQRRLDGTAADQGGGGPFEEAGDVPIEHDYAPLTGEEFRDWSDRLRDVEEMVEDTDLRAEAARIRERAREVRSAFKRHSELPQWDLVRDQIAQPLVELQDRVSEALLRRTSQQAVVPLDRDPVPPQYSEKTRKYYERLGSGK